ncbi:hypothetical protein ACFWBF_28835 [Streptomyces sp. NPDC060028]|uniref:hypothetical protein n=1 Tax=Streptomyces sp. NPDC060028 TaxID=3347041 RepID=UPI0036A16314
MTKSSPAKLRRGKRMGTVESVTLASAQVRLPGGTELTAYLPSGTRDVRPGWTVFVRSSRSPRFPGVTHRIAGVLDH